MDTIRVILADDHPITRAGIKRFLEHASDIEVIAEAEDGVQAFQLTKDLIPDVLLLDMELPGMHGVEVARKLQKLNLPVYILALSSHADRQYIFGVLSNGASGYLTKEEVPQTIVDAVRGVSRGEQGWVSREVAALLAAWTSNGESSREELTPRELQVLAGVVDGKTNREIGVDLDISPKTVEKHLESVYSKLKVASRVEAAVLAVREGLLKN
jgi:DNA-binding NarL/FixJ family response regulator